MDRDRMCELSFASGRYTKACEIVESVMKQLEIPAEMKDVFSLWMNSRNLRKLAQHTIFSLICTDADDVCTSTYFLYEVYINTDKFGMILSLTKEKMT